MRFDIIWSMFGRKLGIGLVTFLGLLTLISPESIKAEVSPTDATMRKQLLAQRCETLTKTITSRIEKWDGNEPEKHKAYNNIVGRVQKMISDLKKKGYDTTELETSLKDLNEAIVKRHEDAKILINLLKDSKLYACGESDGKFKDALKKAQDQWKVVHEDALTVKNVWQNEVRPAIRRIKEQEVKVSVSPKVTKTQNEQ